MLTDFPIRGCQYKCFFVRCYLNYTYIVKHEICKLIIMMYFVIQLFFLGKIMYVFKCTPPLLFKWTLVLASSTVWCITTEVPEL